MVVIMFRTALISLFLTSTALATTWTVDDDGLDFPNPNFDNIQAAIGASSMGDEIIVYPGTYTSTESEVVDMLGKAVWLHSSAGAEVTIIDGEGTRRGINCHIGETNKTIIDGFTITNGYVSGWGGCVYISGSSPTITNCTISNGSTGIHAGGIHIENNANPRFSNCLITDNSVTNDSGDGGGIYCTFNSSPMFEDCEITNNTSAGTGGGIRVLSSDITLIGCTITGNVALNNAGGIELLSNSTATITNCNISDNIAGTSGGGLYSSGSFITIDGTTMVNNTSLNGGGLAVFDNSDVVILMSQITANSASIGGGMYVGDVDCTVGISGSIVGCNTATISHPQIYGSFINSGGNCIVLGDCTDKDGDGVPDECIAICGDGVCSFGEDEITCPEDCATDPVCGDGVCNWNENCITCTEDCGECTVLYVDDDLLDNPFADLTSIQAAIEAIVDGGEIIVSPGTYTSSTNPVVDTLGKAITLRSSDGASVTVIDGQNNRRGVHCRNGETQATVIDGFTITNGYIYAGGGCVHIIDSSPTFTNCTISNSTTGLWGGGIYIQNSNTSPRFTNCIISGNSSTEVEAKGGGIYCGVGCTPIFENCLISNNSSAGSGGGMYNNDSSPTLTDCIFTNNTAEDGGGMYNWSSAPTLTACTISGNTAKTGAGIFAEIASSISLFGDNTSDTIWCQDAGTTLYFGTGSTLGVAGDCVPASEGGLTMDLDDLNAIAPLQLSGELHRQGSLGFTNDSSTLMQSQPRDVIPVAKASSLGGGGFDSIVFPLMPSGLGLQLVEYPALRGGDTEMAVEVIEVEGAQFANPFAGGLDSPPVDITSFDADGDGTDEIAVLFDGTPGGVAVFAVSEDGAPSLIDGFSAIVGNNPVDLDAGYLNDDGLEDLLVANGTSETMTVLVTTLGGDNSLTFAVQQVSCFSPVTSVAVIDWDGGTDLDLDAVVGLTNPNGYQVLLDVAATASSGPWFAVPNYEGIPDTPTCVDGGDQTSAWGFVGGTRYGRVHRAIPSGSLQVVAELGGNNIVTIEAIELDDGDGDGQIDLMVSSDDAETIYLFQGNTSEADGFEGLIPLAVSEPVQDVLAIDADDDGDMDMVMTAPTSDTPLVLLRNDGGGTGLVGGLNGITWSKQDMNSGNPLSDIEPIDVNDDKDIDKQVIVGAGGAPNLRGEPAGTMEQTNILLDSDCVADIDGDGEVNVADLLILIGAWGQCPSCDADLDKDGEVNVADLLILIGAWGSCE